jgi:hypothetical protein
VYHRNEPPIWCHQLEQYYPMILHEFQQLSYNGTKKKHPVDCQYEFSQHWHVGQVTTTYNVFGEAPVFFVLVFLVVCLNIFT